MPPEPIDEILSSKARLKIMDSVSVRPRTLPELADLTGISVQGVLRHLKQLSAAGMVEERSLSRAAPRARKVYAAKSVRVRDYSSGGLAVVKATEVVQPGARRRTSDLEREAGELLIMRRRIREEARKLGRLIDEAADGQDDLSATLDGLPLPPADRLALLVALTEDTMGDGARVLSDYYGLDGRRSIETALAKAKRLVAE